MIAFREGFGVTYDDRITGEAEGFAMAATVERDDWICEPWKEHDGHGPVTAWTSRDKLPGELVLIADQGSRRFYDFAEACRIALRDGWGAKGDEGMTPRQKAAHAARADHERLRAWCEDRWCWVCVRVTASRAGVELGSAALGGIESDAGDYLTEVANELAAEAIADAEATRARLCCERQAA